MYRSHHIGGNSITGCCLGNTKICYLYLAFLGDHNILGFDIPVDDMIVMGSFDTHAHLDGNTDCLLHRQSGLFLDILFEGDPLYKLHDNIINTVLFTDIIYIHDIGMHQACCCLCFYSEFGYEIGILTEFLL